LMDAQLRPLDGLVLPTTPIVAPLIAVVSASFEAFISKNTLGAHNTNIVSSISAQSPRQSTINDLIRISSESPATRKLVPLRSILAEQDTPGL